MKISQVFEFAANELLTRNEDFCCIAISNWYYHCYRSGHAAKEVQAALEFFCQKLKPDGVEECAGWFGYPCYENLKTRIAIMISCANQARFIENQYGMGKVG